VKEDALPNPSFPSVIPSMPQSAASQGGSHEGRRTEGPESIRGRLSPSEDTETIYSADDEHRLLGAA